MSLDALSPFGELRVAGGHGLSSSAYQGSLFSNDFVERSITDGPDWISISPGELTTARSELTAIFARFPTGQTPNETQTEDDLIWRVLSRLGWSEHLRQQNLSARGRQDIPDGILYLDERAKDRAVAHPEEWKRYEFGAAVVESKRWGRPLDRRSEQRNEVMAPSTQMLRYLRRVDDLTNGSLRWGFLTNGARWRLYFSGARSVSEQFFEIDLAAVLGVPGFNEGLFSLTADEQDHWLKVFLLMFRREAFVAGPDRRTFHQRALDEGRFYEERVAQNLSDLVFGSVFPALAQGIAQAVPDTDLEEVRDAALILLYRLLFILYAEDRDLLPVRDRRYDDYGLASPRVRREGVVDQFPDGRWRGWKWRGRLGKDDGGRRCTIKISAIDCTRCCGEVSAHGTPPAPGSGYRCRLASRPAGSRRHRCRTAMSADQLASAGSRLSARSADPPPARSRPGRRRGRACSSGREVRHAAGASWLWRSRP